MNRRSLDLVNQCNLERRQSQAQAERESVESRLSLAQSEPEASGREMGRAVRAAFLERYIAERNSQMLRGIHEAAGRGEGSQCFG